MIGYKKYLLSTLIVLVTLTTFAPKVHAQPFTPVNPIGIGRLMWNYAVNGFPQIDIRRSVVNFFQSSTVELLSFTLMGVNADNFEVCGVETHTQMGTSQSFSDFGPSCGVNIFAQAPGNGSLAGLAYRTGYTVESRDAVPVYMAAYIGDTAQRIPVVGDRAYAQTQTFYTGLPFGNFILVIWKAFRNLAYGLISLMLIVSGIMIMMRKQLDPKTVVTVQVALPRIIIALILVTFSYPIGAVAASALSPLKNFTNQILSSMAFDLITIDTTTLNWGAHSGIVIIISFTAWVMASLAYPAGFMSLFAAFGIATVWIVVSIIAFFKVIITYFKILVSIVASPIIFATSAIPGNEGMTINWFKMLAARVLSIPAMFFLLGFATLIPLYFMFSENASGAFNDNATTIVSNSLIADITGGGQGFIQGWLISIMVPSISILLMIQAIGVGKKVEDAILGNKRR